MIKLVELIEESSFGKSGKVTHVMDVPMFSVYVSKVEHVPQKLLVMRFGDMIKKECEKARNEIHKVGFPSMHANIVIKDLSKHFNQNTGETGVGGLAHGYRKYMEIDSRNFNANTIVHEWAHLWMMNNSKAFKAAVKVLYSKLMKDAGGKIDATNVPAKSLTNGEELKILDMWGDGLVKMFNYMSMDRDANAYAIKGRKLTPDMYSKLPHLFQFNARLKRPIVANSLNGRSVTLRAGTTVYVAKGNSGWLIGKDEGNSRYEILTKTYDELTDYVESGTSGDIVTDIQTQLKKDNLRNKQYNTATYFEGKLGEEIKRGLRRIFEDIAKFFKARVSPEEIATVESWSQYVLPQYVKVLRNPKQMAYYQSNQNKIYDMLWVSNPFKPIGVSVSKFITPIIQRSRLDAYRSDFMDKSSFVGKEFDPHRTSMAQLNNWVNSYGMSNEDELWATAIEQFFKLPLSYRKAILKIMMHV